MKLKKLINYKENTINFFNKMSNKKHGDSFKHYDNVINWIKKFPMNTLLDLGTGKGDLIEKIIIVFSKNNKNLNLIGIDISPKMIEQANKKNLLAEFKVGDSENIEFKDSYFDIITCINSFHHYSNPEKAISEIQRTLKPNGIIILGEIWLPIFLRNLVNFILPFLKTGDYKIYSAKEIEKIFSNQNIKLLEKKYIFPTNYTYLFKKLK
ncbi:class I SAM-dependent methyltransferase [Cetobacterium somerae]|uniref:class I SAM-dependent methyltransferase n=1 Tax=Cetobacterium sp. NK01 TaxID=2993530 RepID=UPI002115D6FA|nr:class I SAM-dependent methyltransferase [Cetobacterium sp. NK01]MCQ8213528.1 class I SAM-dependent methyltransferase [Cetobacterium sp. NK01]